MTFQTTDPFGTMGVVWVGTERIEYERKVGSQLKELSRGTKGTTIQNWYAVDPKQEIPLLLKYPMELLIMCLLKQYPEIL